MSVATPEARFGQAIQRPPSNSIARLSAPKRRSSCAPGDEADDHVERPRGRWCGSTRRRAARPGRPEARPERRGWRRGALLDPELARQRGARVAGHAAQPMLSRDERRGQRSTTPRSSGGPPSSPPTESRWAPSTRWSTTIASTSSTGSCSNPAGRAAVRRRARGRADGGAARDARDHQREVARAAAARGGAGARSARTSRHGRLGRCSAAAGSASSPREPAALRPAQSRQRRPSRVLHERQDVPEPGEQDAGADRGDDRLGAARRRCGRSGSPRWSSRPPARPRPISESVFERITISRFIPWRKSSAVDRRRGDQKRGRQRGRHQNEEVAVALELRERGGTPGVNGTVSRKANRTCTPGSATRSSCRSCSRLRSRRLLLRSRPGLPVDRSSLVQVTRFTLERA